MTAQLSASHYTDPVHHESEMDRLYRRSWTAVGFASELGDHGQVIPRQVAGRPLLLTKDRQGAVHVFDNVCRHRGHLLVDGPRDNARLLTCPYHAWSYSLDGTLVKAPYWDGSRASSPPEPIKQQLALCELVVAIWYDVLFVNWNRCPEPLEKTVGCLDQRWRSVCDPALLRGFSTRSFSMAGNWKLVAENFLDNYHLPWVHPQVGDSIEAALGMNAESLRLGDHAIGFSWPGSATEKRKTRDPLPVWPAMNEEELARQDLFVLFPNVCMVMEGNYLWSMVLLPNAVDQTDEIVSLYVIGDEAMAEHHAASRDELAEAIYTINGQDNDVIRGLQAGRQSSAASDGVFNPHHDQLGIWFHQYIKQQAGEL